MTEPDILPDSWFDWKIISQIGEGAYGTVYKIYNERERKVAALKVISVLEEQKKRAIQELEILIALNHTKHIVNIESYAVQQDENSKIRVLIRMEYLENLVNYLIRKEISEREVLKIGIDICEALEICEKRNIMHRDIKPENIMVSPEELFKLADFGASLFEKSDREEPELEGTYAYMTPEVYHGEAFNKTCDIYSLGLVLYQLLNGNHEPFSDISKQIVSYRDKETSLKKRMNGIPLPPPCNAAEDLSRIIQKACEYKPEKRYQNAKELKKALLDYQKRKDKNEEQNSVSSDKEKRNCNRLLKNKICIIRLCGIVLFAAFMVIFCYSQKNEKEVWTLDDIKCSLNANGLMTVSGTGELSIEKTMGMDDSIITSVMEAPWAVDSGSITKVIVKPGVTSIGNYVFKDCKQIRAVELPDTVCAVGEQAFYNCSKLEEISIPASVTNVGEKAFSETAWAEKQGDFLVVNGILVAYQGSDRKVKIPDSVIVKNRNDTTSIRITVIGKGAFSFNENIQKVSLPEGVTAILEEAFYGCNELREVNNLPDTIAIDAFDGTPYQTKFIQNR